MQYQKVSVAGSLLFPLSINKLSKQVRGVVTSSRPAGPWTSQDRVLLPLHSIISSALNTQLTHLIPLEIWSATLILLEITGEWIETSQNISRRVVVYLLINISPSNVLKKNRCCCKENISKFVGPHLAVSVNGLRVPPETVVWIYDTFDNSFEKYLKESCRWCSEWYFFITYFPGFACAYKLHITYSCLWQPKWPDNFGGIFLTKAIFRKYFKENGSSELHLQLSFNSLYEFMPIPKLLSKVWQVQQTLVK